jgi:hypothetical protein
MVRGTVVTKGAAATMGGATVGKVVIEGMGR